MKTCVVIATAVALAFIGWWMALPEKTSDLAKSPHSTQSTLSPPTNTNTDPTEVFQRAFWKRPTPDDKILHAERREWADRHGVRQWQWFIAVQPSPALVKHLRDDNAFSLVTGVPSKQIEQAPDWFVTITASTQMHSPMGNMRLIFNDKANTLYATDSGGGFKPGAPEPGKAMPQTTAAGRLPTSPPPKP